MMSLHTCINVANNKNMIAPRKMFFVDKMSNILSNGKSLILSMILNLFCKQNYISSCRGLFIFLVTGVFKTSFQWRGMLVNSFLFSLIYFNSALTPLSLSIFLSIVPSISISFSLYFTYCLTFYLTSYLTPCLTFYSPLICFPIFPLIYINSNLIFNSIS